MTTLSTKLYATQDNGGRAEVSIQDIGNLLGSTAAPATTGSLGVVFQSTNVSNSVDAVPANAPAGGTGTAAGGWDTAAHRDAAIATINGLVALTGELQTTLNDLLTAMGNAGMMA